MIPGQPRYETLDAYPTRRDVHNLMRQEALPLVNPGNEALLVPRLTKPVKTVHCTLKFEVPAALANKAAEDPTKHVPRAMLEAAMVTLATETIREWVKNLLDGNINYG